MMTPLLALPAGVVGKFAHSALLAAELLAMST